MSRGALIVFEGGDRSGKSTQCSKLAESLKEKGKPVELLHFPDRESPIGKMIDSYLQKKDDLDDHVIHLLFSANRWEAVRKIREKLQAGVTLVVDRYSFSGVAFSAAKEKPDMDIYWCMQPEKGLPKPDIIIFLDLPPNIAAQRKSFGSERYENVEFQNRVMAKFKKLQSSNWMEFDASKNAEELHLEIKANVLNVMNSLKPEIESLWKDGDIIMTTRD